MKNSTNKAGLFLVLVLITIAPVMAQRGQRLIQFLQQRKAASKNEDGPGLTTVNIQSSGINRTYHIHIPPGLTNSRPTPLVFAFHGGGGKGTGMAKVSNLNAAADQKGFVVVYPDGVDKHWNYGTAKYSKQHDANDVGFVQDMISQLRSQMNLDSTRIYICGLSEGGLFTQRLVCQLPNMFAAAASVGATFPTDANLAATKPFSIMYIQGTADPYMPFKGGNIKGPFGANRGKVLSAEQSVSNWVQYDNCPVKPTVNTYGNPGADLSIESRTYVPGTNNTEVVFCIVKGGGHCWPGGYQYLPPAMIGKTSPIDANDIIWQFFSRHALTNSL